jgi:hypothetical protein
MMQFDVFVQGKLYKTVSAKNVGNVLVMVSDDLRKGLVTHFDSSKNHEIKIVRK